MHNMEEFISLIRYGAEARSTAATGSESVHDAPALLNYRNDEV